MVQQLPYLLLGEVVEHALLSYLLEHVVGKLFTYVEFLKWNQHEEQDVSRRLKFRRHLIQVEGILQGNHFDSFTRKIVAYFEERIDQ